MQMEDAAVEARREERRGGKSLWDEGAAVEARLEEGRAWVKALLGVHLQCRPPPRTGAARQADIWSVSAA